MYKRIAERFYWKEMIGDVRNLVSIIHAHTKLYTVITFTLR